MKCAIMQPTYLPWAGYFHLMNQVNVFVYLDDVQFARRSWQQRNRILLEGKEYFITIPVLNKGKRDQLINEVKVDETTKWKQKHKQTILQAYGKSPYGQEIAELMNKTLDKETASLIDINISFIEEVKNKLEIDTRTIFSSNIPCNGKKSEYLIKLIEFVGADTYVSPPGSRKYIEEEGLFQKSNIKLEYQTFIPQAYPQAYPQANAAHFIPSLSILDVIANLGFEKTIDYISEAKKGGAQ